MSRSRGATRFTKRSPMKTSPLVTASRPATSRSAVVLPDPDGPTNTMNSPSAISSENPDSAVTSSKTFVASRYATTAIPLPLHRAGQDAPDELTLQQNEHDHDGERDDHRGRRDE